MKYIEKNVKENKEKNIDINKAYLTPFKKLCSDLRNKINSIDEEIKKYETSLNEYIQLLN